MPRLEGVTMFEERTQATCPYCGSTFSYSNNEMQQDGRVPCRSCGSIMETRRQPIYQSTDFPTTSDPIFSGRGQTYEKKGRSGASVACGIILVLLFLPLIIAIPIAACIGLWYMSKNRG